MSLRSPSGAGGSFLSNRMVEYPHRLALVAAVISLNVQPAFAEDLSADLIKILEEATASNDQTTIDIVSRTLIAAFPENEDAILAYLEAAPAAGTSDDVLESLDLTATTETKKGRSLGRGSVALWSGSKRCVELQ